jgi:oligogalacturonide lyase
MKLHNFPVAALLTALIFTCTSSSVLAQPVMETGGQKMPDEWIDKDTHHKIIKLSRMEGSSYSFYFHNNPFIGNKMVFYNTSPQKPEEQAAKVEISNTSARNRQIYWVDLKTLKIDQLTNHNTCNEW